MTEDEQRHIFADNLTRIMVAHDKTQADLVRQLTVSKSTVSSWCSGAKLPRMGKIDAICKWLDVKRSDLLDQKASVEIPSPPVIKKNDKIEELANIDKHLNKAGHKEFVRYGSYLAGQPEFQSEVQGKYEAAVEYIRDYITPPAAGYAAPIEGSDYKDVPRDNFTPTSADFSVHVSGDSMEPFIKDGQRVFVKRDCNLEEGDVGIFYYDGQVFIKQFCPGYDGSVYLLSANPKREDANKIIDRDANSTLICFGKVILPHRLPMPAYD